MFNLVSARSFVGTHICSPYLPHNYLHYVSRKITRDTENIMRNANAKNKNENRKLKEKKKSQRLKEAAGSSTCEHRHKVQICEEESAAHLFWFQLRLMFAQCTWNMFGRLKWIQHKLIERIHKRGSRIECYLWELKKKNAIKTFMTVILNGMAHIRACRRLTSDQTTETFERRSGFA